MKQIQKVAGVLVMGTAMLGLLGGCSSVRERGPATMLETGDVAPQFETDRKAILAMAGDYAVTFSFHETVAFTPGYKLKKAYETGAHEIVRVIADTGRFISLQHILIVGGDERVPIKHWRQDWVYEPETVFEYLGHNRWRTRALSPSERQGKWAQLVYQVDDGPRYAAVAAWDHAAGVSSWTSPAIWRPLPRREATKRHDYDVLVAVNRHALTPMGWVHEQDNSKLVLKDGGHMLAREVGLNNYIRTTTIDAEVADRYWAQTKDYWASIRRAWADVMAHKQFGLTIEGEPEPLYSRLLEEAVVYKNGRQDLETAVAGARAAFNEYVRAE